MCVCGGGGVYLTLHCHRQNGSCIKMGSNASHFNVLLIVRNKVTGQCPQAKTCEEKGQPKRSRTEIPLPTSLTPSRWAKPTRGVPFVVCGQRLATLALAVSVYKPERF